MQKPGRPLGLSIAVITSVMLFSILPFIQVLFYLSIKWRFRDIQFMEGGGASGVDIIGLSDTTLIVQAVIAILFLIIAILAWRGQPPSMRYIFMGSVVLLTAITIASTILGSGGQPDIEQIFDPMAALSNSLVRARMIVSILIMIYVLWYVNRGPARAFYRGYYLDDALQSE